MELDDTICYCFHITKRKIFNHIRVHKPRVPSQLSDCGGAGTGCGWCVPFLKRYFAEGQPGATADAVTAAEYEQQRAGYIRSGKGRPAAGAKPLPPETSPPSQPGAPATDETMMNDE